MSYSNYISCSIVIYKNDFSMLTAAIKSVIQNKLISKIFLIDNSPTDEFRGFFENDSRIEYIFNPSNPGFGASHNLALKKSLILGSKFHLVLNPDVCFNSDIIDKIFNYMNDNNLIGNLMPKVYYPNGNLQYLCKLLPTPYDWIGRRFNPFKKIVEKRNQIFELKFNTYNDIIDVPYLSGCFMFLNLTAIKNVGFFDENIFMYGEDTDMCRRLLLKGYKNVYFPEVSIIHEFQKGSHRSLKLTFIGIKSAIYYFNKWGWFIDNHRKIINSNTLKNLGYSNNNNFI